MPIANINHTATRPWPSGSLASARHASPDQNKLYGKYAEFQLHIHLDGLVYTCMRDMESNIRVYFRAPVGVTS